LAACHDRVYGTASVRLSRETTGTHVSPYSLSTFVLDACAWIAARVCQFVRRISRGSGETAVNPPGGCPRAPLQVSTGCAVEAVENAASQSMGSPLRSDADYPQRAADIYDSYAGPWK